MACRRQVVRPPFDGPLLPQEGDRGRDVKEREKALLTSRVATGGVDGTPLSPDHPRRS